MTINEAPLNCPLTVRVAGVSTDHDLTDLESRLMHMGFLEGEAVQVKRRAPLFKEPILVEVRGRLVALSLSEAKLVEVEFRK